MYCGGRNQEPKLQWSRKTGREEQGKKKKTHLPKTKGIKKVIITTDKGIDITSVKIIHKSTIGF